MAGVKQGRCSPTTWPLRKTFVPYWALWIFSIATAGTGPSTRERAAIPEGLAELALLAHLREGRLGHVDQARHDHRVSKRLRRRVHAALLDLPGPVETDDLSGRKRLERGPSRSATYRDHEEDNQQ